MTGAPATSIDRPATIGPGRMVLVVGPSGAGKDTLLILAKGVCAHSSGIFFPRRVVTRAASPSEDNEQVTREAFADGLVQGKFAVHWESHGHCYALPLTINEDIRLGKTVVVNVSRTVIDAIRRFYVDVVVVSITAPPEIRASRLAARGRSSDGNIADRLGRVVDDASTVPDVIIVNTRSADDHARQLVRAIKGEKTPL